MEMQPKKVLMSAIAAMATSKLVKAISDVEVSDVLGVVGLERRRNHMLENLGLIAIGVVAGAGTALLLAPAPGRETRQKVGRELSRLGSAAGEVASEVAAEVRAEAPSLLSKLSHEARNHEPVRS
jgi:hypothetical protein